MHRNKRYTFKKKLTPQCSKRCFHRRKSRTIILRISSDQKNSFSCPSPLNQPSSHVCMSYMSRCTSTKAVINFGSSSALIHTRLRIFQTKVLKKPEELRQYTAKNLLKINLFSWGLPLFFSRFTNCILRLSNDLLSVSVICTTNLKFLTYKSSVLMKSSEAENCHFLRHAV